MHRFPRPRDGLAQCALVVACALLLAGSVGCDSESLFGDGGSADAAVTTPAGVQTGDITLVYRLTGEDGETVNVRVLYTTNGITYLNASEGVGGDGTEDLTVSAAGEFHSYVWDSGRDLPGARRSDIRVKVVPTGGLSDTTGNIRIHNSEFLVTLDDASAGRARLFVVDVTDGADSARGTYATGGTNPDDLIYSDGFFLITHRTTDDVAVLQLDEEAKTLSPVESSPFAGDGIGASAIATDGEHVFVSNSASQTLSVFNFNSSTGALTLSAFSNVSASGCRGLVVRSSRLYVADAVNDRIHVFDIASNGELFTNSASPVTTGGLGQPGALARVGSFLYAANEGASSVSGFVVESGGALTPIAGSPFATTVSPLVHLAANGFSLLGVDGTGARLDLLAVDPLGALTEDPTGPFGLSGDGVAIASTGEVVVASASGARSLHVYTIVAGGGLSEISSSPISVGVDTRRMAFSRE